MNIGNWILNILLLAVTTVTSFFSPYFPSSTATSTPTPETRSSVTSSATSSEKTGNTTKSPSTLPVVAQKPIIVTTQTTKTPITPPIIKVAPLINTSKSGLDALEIIMITNEERAKDGAPPLSFNAKLAEEAMAKAKDMIVKQYFAHKSPDGINVSDLANIHGYAYSLIGENLALGDFVSSRDVMNGWMNSPGHRANILKKGYTEIGVAAIMGGYEGRQVWYAVQEFGRPPPNCPVADPSKESLIKQTEAKMDALAAQLVILKQQIDAQSGTRTEINAAIDQYNTIAATHNDLLNGLKAIITSYNTEIATYNACIAREEAIVGPPSTNTAE